MIPKEIQAIFDFIDFLDSKKKSYINIYRPICKELEKLDVERKLLSPNDNYRDKIQYDIVQEQIAEKFTLIYDNVYNPIIERLKELGIWSGDKSFISIKNNISSAYIVFINVFQLDDLEQVVSYKEKYISFRKETNSNFLTLQLMLSDLDEALKELFDFFKDTDENEFESFDPTTIECKSIEEALDLFTKNSKKNIRIKLPAAFLNPINIPAKNEVISDKILEELLAIKEEVKELSNSSVGKNNNQSSYDEAMYRVKILKSVIEDKGGFKVFKALENQNEAMFQQLFKFVKECSVWDINAEVNNGQGPVDFTVSKGSEDKTVIEFKLAKSSSLKRNLQHQVEVYKKANNTDNAIVAILYFNQEEFEHVTKVLQELNLNMMENVILIDGEQKLSASIIR